jgi:YihY family inner membrane protein
MSKLVHRPLSILVSVPAGMLAGAIFKRIWQVAARQEQAPSATDARRGWTEILIAAALLVIVSIMFMILYWAAPNARHRFRWGSPGSMLAVVTWLIASGVFALYVANFGHYNKVYGSLGGIIVFLIWMWISNVAVLFGAELNAELQRGRAIAGGLPPDQEPFTELRDERKLRNRRNRLLGAGRRGRG